MKIGYLSTFSPVIKNNMASSSKRSRENVDYRQLHSFSSTVLYDTTSKKARSKYYEVEKIIERRRKPQVSVNFAEIDCTLSLQNI